MTLQRMQLGLVQESLQQQRRTHAALEVARIPIEASQASPLQAVRLGAAREGLSVCRRLRHSFRMSAKAEHND